MNTNFQSLSPDKIKKLKELLNTIDTDNKVFDSTRKLIQKLETDKQEENKKD